MGPKSPRFFVLGGAKISDAFGMMEAVCANGTADKILACGVTGQVMLLAQGVKLGNTTEEFLKARDLWCFVDQAKGSPAASRRVRAADGSRLRAGR